MKNSWIIFSLLIGLFLLGCNPTGKTTHQTTITDGGRPVFWSEETEYDLGTIPPDETDITALVLFKNTGDGTLEIEQVTGPCACLAGYSGDISVAPGREGILEIQFDKNKIPSGQVRRLARIQTNDPEHQTVNMYFRFTVERPDEEDEQRVIQNELTAIRKEIRALRSDMRKVLAELHALKGEGRAGKTPAKAAPDITIYDIPVGTSAVRGPENAPVTIVEFADMQCPYCIREYPKIKQILGEYPNQVRLILKHYPLNFHKKAKPAHAAIELVRQERGDEAFWKMHDMIMADPQKLDIEDLRSYAESLEVDLAKFDALMADSRKMDELLDADLKAAANCKVRGTPTVLINGLKMTDRSLEGYRKRINEILNR
jgi:protein-disulfide isomerase